MNSHVTPHGPHGLCSLNWAVLPSRLITDHSLLGSAASSLFYLHSLDSPRLSQPQESVIAVHSAWRTLDHVFEGMLSLVREPSLATSLPTQSACLVSFVVLITLWTHLYYLFVPLSLSACLPKNKRCVRAGTLYVLFIAVFPVSGLAH